MAQSQRATRKLRAQRPVHGADYLHRHEVVLVATSGPLAGSEFALAAESVLFGRGPGVDFAFADAAMSRRHAAFELAPDGYRVRDMGSTNGTFVNGARVSAADLKHADHIRMGEHDFQLVVTERAPGSTHELAGS